jgi:hypothetical protein
MDTVTTYYSKIENDYGTKLKEHFLFFDMSTQERGGRFELVTFALLDVVLIELLF